MTKQDLRSSLASSATFFKFLKYLNHRRYFILFCFVLISFALVTISILDKLQGLEYRNS